MHIDSSVIQSHILAQTGQDFSQKFKMFESLREQTDQISDRISKTLSIMKSVIPLERAILTESVITESLINSSNSMRLSASGTPLRLLLVDDQPYNLFVLREILLTINPTYIVDEALNGQIALDLILSPNRKQGLSSVYDVIFMDLHMPVLDGYHTMEKLNDAIQDRQISLSRTLIIALSAITEQNFHEHRCDGVGRSFNEFLEKPVSMDGLKRILEKAEGNRSLIASV